MFFVLWFGNEIKKFCYVFCIVRKFIDWEGIMVEVIIVEVNGEVFLVCGEIGE